ncbi:MAG: nuclear transport factor 2 family protein [Rhizobacter sp.]|nr:nuclear transport factor 2 family protein [Rhizobacter sp.]
MTATPAAPETVVQRQLDAFNARDLDGWLATYAPDAQQHELGGALLASGRAAIRARSAARFDDPTLHARLLQRAVMGHIVIDHEHVTRPLPDGPGYAEMVCIYEVRDGLIQRATFALGPVRPGLLQRN